MNNRSANRWWWTGGGAIVGFEFGGLAFRWDSFWDWISSANWTTLPAATIGAAIPAIAGVMFAQSLSKRSVRTLREAELDATADYERKQERKEALEAESRRAAWDRLYDSCRSFAHDPDQNPFIAKVATTTRALDQERGKMAKVEDGRVVRSQEPIRHRAREIAWSGALWGIELRSHLPQLIERLHALVETHHVERLRVPMRCMDLLLLIAQDETGWVKIDVDAIIRAVDAGDGVSKFTIGERSETAVYDLEMIAGRQRTAPHETEDVNTFVIRRWVHPTREVDALEDFVRLIDLIEDYRVSER